MQKNAIIFACTAATQSHCAISSVSLAFKDAEFQIRLLGLPGRVQIGDSSPHLSQTQSRGMISDSACVLSCTWRDRRVTFMHSMNMSSTRHNRSLKSESEVVMLLWERAFRTGLMNIR